MPDLESQSDTRVLERTFESMREAHTPDLAWLKLGVARRIGVDSLDAPDRSAVPRTSSPNRPRRSLWKASLGWVAGSIGVAAVLTGVFWTKFSGTPQSSVGLAAARTYTTAPGERATVTLDDGTLIRLNVASRVTVPADYGVTTRRVALEGEAQFVVTADPNNPFSVDAEGTIIRDLATTFFIRAYRGHNPRVAVTDGRVSVQAPAVTQANAIVLDAGEAAAVQDDGTLRTSGLDHAMLSWTQGRLLLRDMPLGAALGELRRWYGKDFRVADSALLPVRINATLPLEMNMDVLRSVADVAGATLHVDEDTITFTGRR